MKRSSKSRELAVEITVGVFVFAALLSLSFFTILLSGDAIFRKSYSFEVVFQDVMGLREGDNVVMRGMPIGKVKKLNLENDGVHLFASLRSPVNFKEDYTIKIVLSSVLGGRYMQIHEGSDDSAVLPEGIMLKGQAPRDLVTEATAVIVDLKEIADKINQGQGTLGMLINDDGLYVDAREIVGEIKTAVKERGMLENIEETASNLGEISARINRGEGTLGMLINDDGLYVDAREIVGEIKTAVKERGMLENIEETASNLGEISARINRGEGTLGKLINEDELYDESIRIFRDARSTLNDLRETAPIVTFTSIFFGVF